MSSKWLRSRRNLHSLPALLGGLFLCLGPAARSVGAEPVAASAATAVRVVTLRESVLAARLHVPTVLAALSRVRQSEAQVLVTRAASWPSASASSTAAGVAQNYVSPGATLPSCSQTTALCSTASGVSTNAYGELSLSGRWTLWDFGRTGLQVKGAALAVGGARADLAAAELVSIAAAATAYYALLADQEGVEASRQILQQRERQRDLAQRRVSAGTNAPIDGIRAEIAVQTARLDLASTEGTARAAAATLAAALAMDPAIAIQATAPPEIVIDDDPAQAAEIATRARPEVAAARSRYESATATLAAARAAWRPSLVLTLAANARRTDYDSSLYADNETATGTISLSLPLFDPTRRPNVELAEAAVLSAQATVTSEELQVRLNAVQAAVATRLAGREVALAEGNVRLNAANLQLSEARYTVGTAQLVELVDAQAQDAIARYTAIEKRFQWERAKVALLALTNHLAEVERD